MKGLLLGAFLPGQKVTSWDPAAIQGLSQGKEGRAFWVAPRVAGMEDVTTSRDAIARGGLAFGYYEKQQEQAERAIAALRGLMETVGDRPFSEPSRDEPQLEAVVAWAIDDRAQLHKDANQLLDENLDADEPVRAIIRGQFASAIIATDRRVFVFKKGWLSGSAFAKKLSSWDYRNVSGIRVEIGSISGTVTISAAGAEVQPQFTFIPGTHDPAKAANAVKLDVTQFDQAKRGAAAIRSLIAAYASHVSQPAAAHADPSDQLRKLAELRDEGILTDDEFATKKAEILGRM
jgi:hypothetical protein